MTLIPARVRATVLHRSGRGRLRCTYSGRPSSSMRDSNGYLGHSARIRAHFCSNVPLILRCRQTSSPR
jgi:hypothetical protein